MQAMEDLEGEIIRPMPAIFLMRKESATHYSLREFMRRAKQNIEEIELDEMRELGIDVNSEMVGIVDRQAATFNPRKVLDKLYATIIFDKGTIKFENPVTAWERDKEQINVETKNSNHFNAKALVIAAGAWTPGILEKGSKKPDIIQLLNEKTYVRRVPLYYFDYPKKMRNIILIILSEQGRYMYSMPEIRPDGRKFIKVGFHESHKIDRLEAIDRQVSDAEKEAATNYMEKLIGKKILLRETSICLYDMTKDKELPFIDRLPDTSNVYIAFAGGGICAKHAIALGEALSNIIEGKPIPFDLNAFKLGRL